MSCDRQSLVRYLTELLRLSQFRDSSLNGLQLEGNTAIRKVGAAVDCGGAVIEKAIAEKVDLLLVHHGMFWGKPLPIIGAHRDLIANALRHELNIFAAHLPLDAHEELGNNALIAKHVGLTALRAAVPYDGSPIGCIGENTKQSPRESFVERLKVLPGSTRVDALPFGPKIPERVCVVTGSAADTLYRCQEEGFDTLITGEPKQFAYHFCRDNNLNAIFAGHYATETVGVIALAEHVAAKFALEHVFVDIPTGI